MNEDDWDSQPLYIRLAEGLDTTWRAKGNCRGKARTGQAKVWFMEDDHPGIGEPGRRANGHKLALLALGVCSVCPAQYDCVSYAIKARQEFLIWAVRAVDRKWLRDHHPDTWEDLVKEAQANKETVQSMVTRLRGPRRARKGSEGVA